MAWEDAFHFEFSDEEQMVRDTARTFAEREVLPLAKKIDHEHYFPSELIPKMGSLGFMGVCAPEEFGGVGLSQVAYACIIEEIAAACASTSVICSAHNSLCIAPILEFGTANQKREYLPMLTSAKGVGCFALSEPGTGSDAAAQTCISKRVGDKFIVSGTKNWITNAPVAKTCILFTMQDAKRGYKGITTFVHSMDHPGVSVGKKEDKLGICGSPTASITYDQAEFTKENLIGEELNGFRIAMATLNGGRIGVAAQAVGIARAALRDALNYSKQRKAFGKFINEHQSIQNYLAEMIVRVDSARYLTLGAARLKDLGRDYKRQAAMAKLYASETAMYCGNKGIQIHGGYGYVKEFAAERHLRDAKITEIYEGTSEIQRMIIAESLARE